MEIISLKKLSTIAAVPALAVSLAACGDSGASNTSTSEPSVVTETVTEQSAEETAKDDSQDDAQEAASPAASAQGELPKEISGYSPEAEAEMGEEGITEADVERVLAAANNGDAGVEVEWDDDGYWEIELGEIDIDIDPDGVVLDVDKDD